MTAQLRIHPSFLPASGAAQLPWRWIPLSLVFRKRRQAGRPAPAIAQPPSASPRPVSYFTRHLHYHTHEGARISLRNDLRETILREQSVALRSSPTVAPSPNPANTAPLLHTHEHRIETRLGLRVTHDQAQMYTRVHRIERIAREFEAARVERASPPFVDATILLAQKRSRIPQPERPRELRRTFTAQGRSMERTVEIRMEPPHSKTIRETPTRGREAERSRAADVGAFFTTPAPVQQVWRTQPAREPSRETVSTGSPAVGTPPAPRSQLAAAQIQTSNQTPLPSALPKLDGPEIDRLADKVMKRIERHVRIERERRGK